MRELTTTGLICVRDDYGIEYMVSKISYTVREDESYKYVFTPNYSVIDLLTYNEYQGIPGSPPLENLAGHGGSPH